MDEIVPEFWIDSENRIISFHPVEEWTYQKFASEAIMDAYIIYFIEQGYRFM